MDWDKWIKEKEDKLRNLGYSRANGGFWHEDFSYHKKFDGYQTVVLFYDFRKYERINNDDDDGVGFDFKCLLTGPNRIDLDVSGDDITIETFEVMSREFYNALGKYA